jgi:hypothetical protein
MRRAFSPAVIVVSLALTAAAQTPSGVSGANLNGRLYKSVFFSGPGSLAAADLAAAPAEVRARLERYLQRRGAFTSRLENGASDFETLRAEAKKRVVERAIVALIEAPDIESAAAAYAQSATILYEWEQRPDGPLAEATGAEEFLKKDPSTPLAPYLYVFIAERQRAAFEMMTPDSQKADMTAAAKKYRTFMQRARAVEDPIFRLLADDMERVRSLYAQNGFHPRDFDPDS